MKRNGEELCITADEAYDILASQCVRQSVEQYMGSLMNEFRKHWENQ